ncbi:MAG: response regulator [Planctomycetes bacterium]|nr:response regulator [Planctomycetota bacterium]
MKPRILIVDDEALVRGVFSRRLLREGDFECDEAANGRQAVELAKQNHYDLVITDIVMPDEDGIELINWYRHESPETPIFAVSAAPNDLFLRTALKLGAQRSFLKPFPLDDLVEAVREILGVNQG